MFLHVSVCPRGRRGHAWQGGVCSRGGRVWRGDMCEAGDVHGTGVCMAGACVAEGGMFRRAPPRRYYEIRSMSGRYASYWNAFLFTFTFRTRRVRRESDLGRLNRREPSHSQILSLFIYLFFFWLLVQSETLIFLVVLFLEFFCHATRTQHVM